MRLISTAALILLQLITYGNAEFTVGQNLLWFYSGAGFFKDNVDFATVKSPWKQVVIDELRPFTVIRMMDAGMTNLNYTRSWSERVQKTDSDQYPTWEHATGDKGMAYEWMIDLCNQIKRDIWFCFPVKSIHPSEARGYPDYALRLAILVKTGVDMKAVDLTPYLDNLYSMTESQFVAAGGVKTIDPLHEKGRVYLEYGNEIWNSLWGITSDQGASLGIGTQKWVGLASLRIFAAFYKVFGEDSPRVYGVFPGQAQNADHIANHLAIMNDPQWNPQGIKPKGISIATYCGTPESDDQNQKSISEMNGWIQDHKNLVQGTDIEMIAYESGQHITNNSNYINRLPKMYDVYNQALSEQSKLLTGVYCHYGYAGAWFGGGAWGSKEYPGQPTSETPKYRALLEWAQRVNPAPADYTSVSKPAFGTAPQSGKNTQALSERSGSVMYDLAGRKIALPESSHARNPGLFVSAGTAGVNATPALVLNP